MYLHLGNGQVARYRDIIGIFDIENTSVSKYTKRFLYDAEKAGRVRYISLEMPRSFVVTDKYVYISPISAATLRKRAEDEQ